MNDRNEGKAEMMEYFLKRRVRHPYINREPMNTEEESRQIVDRLNADRSNPETEMVNVTYYYEVEHDGPVMEGLANAAKMIIEHGTVKAWKSEGTGAFTKPADFDKNMSRVVSISLIEHNPDEKMESGLIKIAYPLHFFDKTSDGRVPLSQLMMAIASEPFSAFSFYEGAKIIDIAFPESMRKRFQPNLWPHKRVREYLGIGADEPIIGTIVKPKAGLTPEIFADSVVQAALAGARFTKADENMHLRLNEVGTYVSQVVKELDAAGFDLGKGPVKNGKKRFLFAPHITAAGDEIMEYARAAVEAGANALMFSPYYGGGFERMGEISRRFDVPVYAHTAGMNAVCGSLTWGIDSSIMYRLAALYGAAFMQLTAVRGYLKPGDTEKEYILKALSDDGLLNEEQITLVIAGGVGAGNIGTNMKELGMSGKMFLAGSSVYSHPDGPSDGVKAILLAYEAYRTEGITEKDQLIAYSKEQGEAGKPLARALGV